MYSKSLLIAIAAFAVTATGVHAYSGTKLLDRAGLSEDQVTAMEEARGLRASGDYTAARDKLVKAGITEDTLLSVHRVASEAKNAINEALKNNDYEAFKLAIADSPLADIITSPEDFKQFKEAHDLRQSGEIEQAEEIMDELGVEGHRNMFGGGMHRTYFLESLTDDQREALSVARQANDRSTMQAILDEAGVDLYPQHHMMGR
ncbi:MAG: hypothetical protein RLZZ230_96 [Candidatus Parcubacteria bacterium]|jgi:DNA-directed RNA polymerase subunit N (RpoN/RPB10)